MRHQRWINLCYRLAHKSKSPHYKHCAILVRGGRVVSIGINKLKSGYFADPLYELKGWHSEADCLLSTSKEKVNGSVLYVAGLSKANNPVNSKPCPYCQQFINKFDLKEVYYADENKQVHRYA